MLTKIYFTNRIMFKKRKFFFLKHTKRLEVVFSIFWLDMQIQIIIQLQSQKISKQIILVKMLFHQELLIQNIQILI